MSIWIENPGWIRLQPFMSKIPLALVFALLLSTGIARCADSAFLNPDKLYQVYFTQAYLSLHGLSSDPTAQIIIKIDAVNKANPNWVLVEFPQAVNQSYTSSLAGKRWINLNYVLELRAFTPLPGQ
jgi:hypothetical protein